MLLCCGLLWIQQIVSTSQILPPALPLICTITVSDHDDDDDDDGDDGDDDDDNDDSDGEDDGDGDDYISRTLKTRLSKQKHRWRLLVRPPFLGSTIFAIESKQHRIDMNSRFHQSKQTKVIHSNN